MSKCYDTFTKKQVRTYWRALGDIPVDDDGITEIEFMDFPAGTDREDIWHWFESEFNLSVHDLMYGSY